MSSFLERFFSERGPFTPNIRNEAAVCCPFLHNKGYETRPSAHVNLKEGLFHCKTCQAEGRFKNGGLSEVEFISKTQNVTYEEACEIAMLDDGSATSNDVTSWEAAVKAFVPSSPLFKYLVDERGLTQETIRTYKLGFQGDGISYPIFIYNSLLDIRTYDPGGQPKMRSRTGAIPLLFPFDIWRNDDRPSLVMAGENDTLLTRQLGFNAVTGTGGEGNFPMMFVGLFKGKKVYVVGDCDETGKKAAEITAFKLKDAGAEVHIVDLGLSGTKEDKDLTDYVLKHGKTAEDLQALLDEAPLFDEISFQRVKNEQAPLVNLWDVSKGENSGQRLSTRVTLAGKYDMVMQIPSAIEWRCKGRMPDDPACKTCPIGVNGNPEKGLWTLKEKNLKDVFYMADVNEQKQRSFINSRCSPLPPDCPNGKVTIKAKRDVHKVVFTPDVETEDEDTGFRSVEQYAYVVGHQLDDGARYRAFFRSYPHPTDGQRVFMVVDKIEESDNALNMFKMTPQIAKQLEVFQGLPEVMMPKRAEMAKDIVGNHAIPNVVYAVDLVYHSPLAFRAFNGREYKGYPEGAVIGESRTGKTSVAVPLQKFYGLGNFTALKGATVAGLLGGADKLPSGGHKITWGMIPRNHKGMVILDEMSGIPKEVLAAMTDLRSSGTASVTKIVRGKAPAKTRLLWMSNPRPNAKGVSTALYDYPTGVSFLLELIGSDEDIARFDFIVSIISPEQLTSPFDPVTQEAHPAEVYRNLIYWIWTRSTDQIVFDVGVEQYLWQVGMELFEQYNSDVKLFGPETAVKLARIAVATAGCCFSASEDLESLIVKKEHVDWAAKWLVSNYDNPIFRLKEYVTEQKVHTTTNEAVNVLVGGLCRKHHVVIKALLQTTQPFAPSALQTLSGMEKDTFGALINSMAMNYLVQVSANGYLPTRRLRKAVEVFREGYRESKMIPLSEQGGYPV
jgi:hypothetical protein